MPKKLTEKFLKECYEKDDHFFTVYDHYTPNYNRAIVTGKFYSRFDVLDLTKANTQLVDDIKRTRDKLPRDKYPWPITEAQTYGWFDPLVLLDRNDKRFYAPCKTAAFITHEIMLRRDRTMQKPKFVGIPFKL